MCTIGPQRFSRFLNEFHDDHPNIEMTLHDVTPTRISDLLLEGGLTCVFCARSAEHDQRFGAFDTVPLLEISREPYLDRLHCEFRDDFLKVTKASGMGVSVMPTSSAILNTVAHRPVHDLPQTRQLELVMTIDAMSDPALIAFRDAAALFDWQ